MQLKYGNFSFDPNSVLLSVRQETMINAGGQPYAQRRIFQVHGYLSGNGQAALTQAENALKTALAVPFRDLVFSQDSGAPSSEILTNAGSITGVKITSGPSFTTTTGPEYCTLRTFDFTAEAEYPFTGTGNFLLDFHETLTFSGGLPLYVHRLALNGPPQKQLVYKQTVFVVTQQGSATGYLAYPTPQAPKFPGALKEAPRITKDSPARRGNGYQGWKVNWSYTFESAGPLQAVPALWVS